MNEFGYFISVCAILVAAVIPFIALGIAEKNTAKKLLKETEDMRIRRKREDLLYEIAISASDIPHNDPRWLLMLNRAREIDEEIREAFPKEELRELSEIISQWRLSQSVQNVR
ncbi:hypothetical protein HYW94_01355 [Candidatus Uhrbacteria bacterium]|nr:hypothetical protein [Candidatus Uhrbacteria bacterium]